MAVTTPTTPTYDQAVAAGDLHAWPVTTQELLKSEDLNGNFSVLSGQIRALDEKTDAALDAVHKLTYRAARALSGHRLLVLDEAGELDYADAATPGHAHRVLGLSCHAAEAHEPLAVLREGEIEEPSWGWLPGGTLYLGRDGQPTQTPPTTPDAAYSLIVGFAVTPTRAFIGVRFPIFLTNQGA